MVAWSRDSFRKCVCCAVVCDVRSLPVWPKGLELKFEQTDNLQKRGDIPLYMQTYKCTHDEHAHS